MQEIKETTAYRAGLKDKIQDTAMRLFTECGIRAVKMSDIASQLGISKRTLYEIFTDKEELLFGCIRSYDQHKKERLALYFASHNVIEVVLEAYRLKVNEVQSFNPVFYDDILKYPKLVQYIRQNHEQARQGFLDFMQRGVSEGLFREGLDYTMVYQMFEAIGQYIMNDKLFKQYTLRELFVNLYLVALRGICSAEGLRLLDEQALEFGK